MKFILGKMVSLNLYREISKRHSPSLNYEPKSEDIIYYCGTFFLIYEGGENEGNILILRMRGDAKFTHSIYNWMITRFADLFERGVRFIFLAPEGKYKWVAKLCNEEEEGSAQFCGEGVAVQLSERIIKKVLEWQRRD